MKPKKRPEPKNVPPQKRASTKVKTVAPVTESQSRLARRQAAFEGGDEETVAEIDREIYEEWHGIPKEIRTRTDVQKYFQYLRKWLLEGEDTLVRYCLDRESKYPNPDCEKELSQYQLHYWRGKLPQFNAIVRMDELKAEADLLDSKEYRAVKGIIEDKIQLCTEDLAKHSQSRPNIQTPGALWLGSSSQLENFARWLTDRGMIERDSKQAFLSSISRNGAEKIVWRDTATLLAQVFQLLGQHRPMVVRNWAKTAGNLFCDDKGKPLKYLSGKAKKAGDTIKRSGSRWEALRDELLTLLREGGGAT